MFCVKCTLAAVVFLALAIPACAFTFSYGNLLDVPEVKNKEGVLQMPLTRKKYKNVKVLSKQLYRFMKHCTSDCNYEPDGAKLEVTSFRAAATRADMWIADVSVNSEIGITCLVFKNGNEFSIKLPDVVKFKNAAFKKDLQKYIEKYAAEQV